MIRKKNNRLSLPSYYKHSKLSPPYLCSLGFSSVFRGQLSSVNAEWSPLDCLYALQQYADLLEILSVQKPKKSV